MHPQTFRLFYRELNEKVKQFELDKNQLHWITKVLRKKDGDIFTVLNGSGGSAQAQFEGKVCHISHYFHEDRKLCEIDFCIAMVSLDKAKLIVEKLTELGVGAIHFVKSQRSHKALDEQKHKEKLELKAVESIRQCGNLYLPKISFSNDLAGFLNDTKSYPFKVFLNEHEKATRLALTQLDAKSKLIVSVGPEASWSDMEKQCFMDHGFQSVSLGPNVLRVETAAIAAAAQLVAFCEY